MVTPIILFMVLIFPFWLATVYYRNMKDSRIGGVLGLSFMLMVAGAGHFYNTEAMTQLLPPFIPYPVLLIILTGILEFIIALGLLTRTYRKTFGWISIVLFISFFPFNVYGAYEGVEFGGHEMGVQYLFIRAPLQLLFIFWAYWFCISDWDYEDKSRRIDQC